MQHLVRALVVACSLVAAAGCSGGIVTLTPSGSRPGSAATPHPSKTPSATPTPGSAATPSPSPSPTGSASAGSAAQINAAMQSVETYYQSLPHQNLQADLQSTAAYASTQSGFTAAQAQSAGVAATLENGALAYFFADKGLYTAAQGPPTTPTVIQGGSPHEIAFLEYDYRDTAFVPSRQIAFAAAFAPAGYPTANYRAEEGSASLANVAALQNGGVDVLDISTHGGVYQKPSGSQYLFLSTTPVTTANMQTWSVDLKSGNLVYGLTLYPSGYVSLATFAFTPAFITSHVTFNPGAIVDNISCFGGSPLIATSVENTLFAANVGMYFGWTKSVRGIDSDDSDAFLLDRTLGEQDPSVSGLATYVAQRTPAQRPFSLSETYNTMSLETRNDPLEGSGDNYVSSTAVNPQLIAENMLFPPSADGPVAHFIEAASPSLASGAPIPANGIIEYGRPSIELASVNEAPTATLTLYGEFPSTQGTLVMSGSQSSSAGATPLSVTSWSPSMITATIPPEGATAAGYLYVISVGGVPSNPVPLTQWAGTAHVVRSFTLGSAPFNNTGSGTATIAADFTFHFRADVHPVVGIIDQDALSQNFFFPGVESDASGTFSTVTGQWTSTNQQQTATISSDSPPLMVPFPSSSQGSFDIMPTAIDSSQLEPAGCNDGVSGLQGGPSNGPSNVFCAGLSFGDNDVLQCTDNVNGSVCGGNPAVAGFGIASSVYAINATPFALDSNYNVTVTPNLPASDGPQQVSSFSSTSSTTETFQINAPLAPPDGMTPALHRRR